MYCSFALCVPRIGSIFPMSLTRMKQLLKINKWKILLVMLSVRTEKPFILLENFKKQLYLWKVTKYCMCKKPVIAWCLIQGVFPPWTHWTQNSEYTAPLTRIKCFLSKIVLFNRKIMVLFNITFYTCEILWSLSLTNITLLVIVILIVIPSTFGFVIAPVFLPFQTHVL